MEHFWIYPEFKWEGRGGYNIHSHYTARNILTKIHDIQNASLLEYLRVY